MEDRVARAVKQLQADQIVPRMWQKDHTVWSDKPTEITDRLGWLNVAQTMLEHVPALIDFSRETRDAGIRDVVLLGMGGSSLGPEVLNQVFGSAPTHPSLTVLDSTIPAAIAAMTDAIDIDRTLFLVSSKSGGTIETLSLYGYFKGLYHSSDLSRIKQHFVAITDPGTYLARLGEAGEFRHVFLNPEDIGGRYSVLSYFGLVPAVLLGIDINQLLDSAVTMQESCASSVPCQENQGAWLGAGLGAMAKAGRDKLTLLTSPRIASFGLWLEQLIAESTGKNGTGIVPVTGEPIVDVGRYDDDRQFVFFMLEGDDNSALDGLVAGLKSAGHPVVVINLKDRYDLGAEFYRWEFATAVAGAILGINPFDQPNVQQAKDTTGRLLKEHARTSKFEAMSADGSLANLIKRPRHKYFAIIAYLRQTPEVDQAFNHLRRAVLERYKIATTLGYGPRFLHSTGQLHKGGPGTGLFLQITTRYEPDLAIPGKVFSFGELTEAEAMGDFQSLKDLGRRAVRVCLDEATPEAIERLWPPTP
ncbi:MAG: glucose-6-phosphate isomerase [Chloroflexi bacterium]|nr:glucose-6-phosphate isomerase [Chloroflexota bacterium]